MVNKMANKVVNEVVNNTMAKVVNEVVNEMMNQVMTRVMNKKANRLANIMANKLADEEANKAAPKVATRGPKAALLCTEILTACRSLRTPTTPWGGRTPAKPSWQWPSLRKTTTCIWSLTRSTLEVYMTMKVSQS
jgi:hypothetical protein